MAEKFYGKWSGGVNSPTHTSPTHSTFYTLHFTFAIALAMALTGCSDLRPTAKTQTMSLYAIGIPGIAVITQSRQDADNRGDDENKPTQTNPVTVEVPIK